MTAEKENIDLFRAELIAERESEGVIFRLYFNRILYVRIKRFQKIDREIIDLGYEFVEEMGGGEFHNIYQFDSFSDVEPEVREWAADGEGNFNTITDAIVIDTLSQKIIADFYLRFNKPVKPTKIFYSLEKAVIWTLEQM